MKILMIAPEPFFEPRGTPLSVYQRLYALSKLGHQIDLLTYHVGKDINLPHVSLHRIPPLINVKEIKVGPSLVKPFLDVLLFAKAILLMLLTRYDAIHSHEEAAFMAVILSKLFRVNHIYDMHSSLPKQLENSPYGWRPLVRIFEILENWVFHTCDCIITIGKDLEALVRAQNPSVPLMTIENLPLHANGMQTTPATLDKLRQQLQVNGRQTVVYTGTLEPYQGIDLLMKCAQLVIQEYANVCFILVGGKPKQVAQWHQVAHDLQIKDHIRFTGIVSPEEAVNYLDMADILISPRTEGLSVPLKIYSYLYAGKPIVATRLLAHTQVLDDTNSLLVKPDANALAKGVLHLLQDPDLKNQLGKQAYEFAAHHYNFSDYLDKLEVIYPRYSTVNKSSILQNARSPYGKGQRNLS